MFGITTIEAAVLLVCLAGVASAVIGRGSGLLSTREALLALAAALALPVVGSLISLVMVATAWHEDRRTTSIPHA